MCNKIYEKVLESYKQIREKTDFVPRVGIVLGSGLGEFCDCIDIEFEIPYSEIKGFPVSTVKGHSGKFVFGTVSGVKVAVMQGRLHFYEGYDMTDVVLPLRVLKLMGIDTVFLTNAAGGIRRDLNTGDLMMITNQIASLVPSPMIGANIDQLGERFFDMTEPFDIGLREALKESAKGFGIDLKEGVYIQVSGPQYETAKEIDMYEKWGADAVAMSLAVEVIAARHMGLKTAGISLISNPAAGRRKDSVLTHEEVQIAGKAGAKKMAQLISGAIKRI